MSRWLEVQSGDSRCSQDQAGMHQYLGLCQALCRSDACGRWNCPMLTTEHKLVKTSHFAPGIEQHDARRDGVKVLRNQVQGCRDIPACTRSPQSRTPGSGAHLSLSLDLHCTAATIQMLIIIRDCNSSVSWQGSYNTVQQAEIPRGCHQIGCIQVLTAMFSLTSPQAT